MRKVHFLAFILLLILSITAFAAAEDAAWTCPECGKEGNTGNFCGNCGHPSPAKPWICDRCKAENSGADQFCSNCGLKRGEEGVSAGMITPKPTATPSPTPAPTPAPTPSPTHTPAPTPTRFIPTPEPTPFLSPNNKCPVQPMIYSSPRWQDPKTEKAYGLNGKLSASVITKNQGTKNYGLYFKFTPGGNDNGYLITRFDMVVTGPDKREIWRDGFNTIMECTAGYYWAWNFFPLQPMFNKQLSETGTIQAGSYLMDIYFNGLWAGKTQFAVTK